MPRDHLGMGPRRCLEGMDAVRPSATGLLLQHCHALTNADTLQPSAYHRLEVAVGNELARLLISALAARPRVRAAA